jgi:hypothetical protein
MKINQVLVESAGATVAFAFGRFNPAHQGHIEVWRAVEQAGANWFIGTNATTIGPNDPLTFEQKSSWMEEIYPAIAGHIVAQTSVLTLAAYIFKKLRNNERASIAYITDETDWAWSGKLLNQYNGVEGSHGYYKFAEIVHVPSPRVSSATALRDAARADDRVAFYHASGTDPKSKVAGLTYFDTVKQAVEKYPLPVKRVKKVKEEQIDEIDRRGFLKGLGAAAVAGAAGSAMAQPGIKKFYPESEIKMLDFETLNAVKNRLENSGVLPEVLMIHPRGVSWYPNGKGKYIYFQLNKEPTYAEIVPEKIIKVDIDKQEWQVSPDRINGKVNKSGLLDSVNQGVAEHIVKVKGGYELKSKHGDKNLGKYPTKAGAEKRERQVQYFKHANEDVTEGSLNEMTSKLISAEDRNGVITVVVQAPDGTKRSLADENPRYIQRWLMKYGLILPKHITNQFAMAEDEQKTVAKTWDQMTAQEKISGVKGRTVWNEKTKKYYTVFDVPAKEETDEATSLATMRDYFAGDADARDPYEITKQRLHFSKDKNGKTPVQKKFRSQAEYADWLRKNKLKQITGFNEDDKQITPTRTLEWKLINKSNKE